MGRLRFSWGKWVVVEISLFLFLPACGGHKPPGAPTNATKITLNPATSTSLQLGTTMLFTASAVNSANSNISTTFTYALTPTSAPGILDISPIGFACAGTWNAPYYSVCTPAGIGIVQVTASAFGETSPPTYVFVHPPIATIQISAVPPVNSPPPACPTQIALPAACDIKFTATDQCLSTNQIQTLQATALDSQGTDITSSVGLFTWSEVNFNVVKITPIVNSSLNVATNQVTASPTTPGQTQVIASAAGVSSQPYNFETCPVQCITLDLSTNGEYTGQTSFTANVKAGSQTVTATAVDIQGCIVPKPPLTWTSSEPGSLSAGSSAGCAATTCSVSLKQPGSAAITASCTPPTCNIGFPLNPLGYQPPFSLYVPAPVYPVTAISGLITGTPTPTNVLATSQDCYSNSTCTVGLYEISTSKNLPAGAISFPTPPNSLMFDPAGDKAYAGSQYGALLITAANIGSSSTNPFTSLPAAGTTLGLVTGKIIAIAPTGNLAIFSDTVSTPNQVYVVNTTSSPTTTPLNINSAITAAFSPDGLEAYILGDGGNTLYVYSSLEALQTYPLTAPANAIAFSSTGAFAFLSGGSTSSNVTIRNTCDNSAVNLSVPNLPGPLTFLQMVPAGNLPISGVPSAGLDVFIGLDNIGSQDTGLDIFVTNASQGPLTTLCPQGLTLPNSFTYSSTTELNPWHIDLQHGHFHPINFFLSPDATQAYIVTSDVGVLVYSFNTRSVSAIPLLGGAAPLAASMTVDGSLIYVAGTDGMLHYLNTALAADQAPPIAFSPLVNSSNNFCYSSISCSLNIVAVQP